MLIILTFAILVIDIGLTWYLLTKYHKRVTEGNALAQWLFKGNLIGNLIFVGARICIVALVIEFSTWVGLTAYIIVTGYAVINNILILKKLRK